MFDSTRWPANQLDARPLCDSGRRTQAGLSGVLRTFLFAALLLGVAECAEKATIHDPPELKAAASEQPESSSVQKGDIGHRTDKPVIWCFVGSRDIALSVETALRSGLITHVAIFSGNRVTSDTLRRPETKAAIEVVKRAKGVQLILVRYLWQTQPGPRSTLETLADPNYYVGEITRLREEAVAVGASLVGLDAEAYGPTALTRYFRNGRFTEEDLRGIEAAIDAATAKVGKVDFILPAGSARNFHPYLALARLGKQRIAEGTYYDSAKRIASIGYSYEIAGMYMNVVKNNIAHPHLPYFLPSEVFGEKRGVWQRTEGLMIWPREERSLEVANALVEASKE